MQFFQDISAMLINYPRNKTGHSDESNNKEDKTVSMQYRGKFGMSIASWHLLQVNIIGSD